LKSQHWVNSSIGYTTVKIGLTYTVRNSSDAHRGSNGNGVHASDAEEEFDSPETIASIAAALGWLGHDVELLGDGLPLMRRLLAGPLPELVFNIAEGRGLGRCREAWVPAILEMFGIPCTGSDPLTLAATLDKDCAKRLVREAGAAVPEGVLVDGSAGDCSEQLAALPLPVIVKPAFEGSSKGISVSSLIHDHADLNDAVAHCQEINRQPVLVEEFIDGDELTVGIIGNAPPEIIGVMRVRPVESEGPFIYGLDVKRDWRRQVRYETPARLNLADSAAVRHAALAAFRALGCRDVARIDFRLREGVPYFLEANPLPGLAPGSGDLVLLAEGMEIDYQELIGRIVGAALGRIAAVDMATSPSSLSVQT
jgi:D-alanine-D-alanine ligase